MLYEEAYDPLYTERLARAKQVDNQEDSSKRLRSIVDEANKDESTHTYLRVEVPVATEEEGLQVLELANAIQRRIFVNAEGVEMRSTVIPTSKVFNATLIVKKKGSEMLKSLYGNNYIGSDVRQTEEQCISIFESEFKLVAQRVAEHAYFKESLPVYGESEEQDPQPFVYPTGLMTVFFVDTGRVQQTYVRATASPYVGA
jgi:hypothetical protein